jgi:hypothetical protein
MSLHRESGHGWSRREFLARGGKLSVAALAGLGTLQGKPAAASHGQAKTWAQGRVFLDLNGSGQAIGQPGIPRVRVSNGEDVVQTDEEGRYRLPIGDEGILHVIKPRGYRVALDENNLPRSYYLHRPQGSPDANFLFKGIAPTGPLPASVDFALYLQKEADDFSILVTSDPQPIDLQHLEWYARSAIPRFCRHDVAFGIACGDLVWGLLDLYPAYNAVNALCGFPWHSVKGNHDLNLMAADDYHAAETFRRFYGPSTYAFQYARVHFIILDNVYYEGFAGMRLDGWPERTAYRGKIRPEDLRYVENYLAHVDPDERVVVCTHIPLFNPRDPGGRNDTPELRKLLTLLSPFRHTLSFTGHVHINRNDYLGAEHGYTPPGGGHHHHCNLTATSGSFYAGPKSEAGIPFAPGRDGSPKGYALVHFCGSAEYRIDIQPLDCGGHPHYACDLPQVIARDDLGEVEAQINVFAGSEKTRVAVRIDGGAWQALEARAGIDRRYLKLRERSLADPEKGGGPLLPPLPTPHLWPFALPEDLEAGWHTLQLRITGDFGDVHEGHHPFCLVEDPADNEPLLRSIRTERPA